MDLAYLDAGTGSYLAAAIVGGFAGAMVVVKTWGRRVLSKLGLRRSATKPAAATEPPSDAEAPAEAEAKVTADRDH
jgi:hypothetical protein